MFSKEALVNAKNLVLGVAKELQDLEEKDFADLDPDSLDYLAIDLREATDILSCQASELGLDQYKQEHPNG
jgi:hypothetical protein